mgnify:CR=1 FL=1
MLQGSTQIKNLIEKPIPVFLRVAIMASVLEHKIIKILKRRGSSTDYLCTKIYGRKVAGSNLTPILYKMASQGLIIRHNIKGRHIWEWVNVASINPLVVPL